MNNPETNSEERGTFGPALKRTEAVLVMLALFGIITKLLHASFSGPILIIIFSALSFYYSALGLYLAEGKFSFFRMRVQLFPPARKLSLYLPGMAISLLCLGSLFKLMHWEGFTTMLEVGLFLNFAVAIPMDIFRFNVTRNEIYKQLIIRCVIYSCAGAIFYLT